MATIVHVFDWPDRFVVGTVGRPGERTFYLQVRDGSQLLSVALEKQQSAALADRIDEILDELMSRSPTIPARAPKELADNDPLDQPIDEQFRVGVMSLGWDPSTSQIVIEAYPLIEDDDAMEPEDLEPAEALIVRIPVGSARAFAERTREIVAAGRPLCPLCGNPLDASVEHICELPDGLL